MLELWRGACAAACAAWGIAAFCSGVGAGDGTLLGWTEDGAAGACFACAMKPVSALAVIAAKASAVAAVASFRARYARLRSEDRALDNKFNREDLIGTLSRITNGVVKLRVARRCSARKMDGLHFKTKRGTAVPCPYFVDPRCIRCSMRVVTQGEVSWRLGAAGLRSGFDAGATCATPFEFGAAMGSTALPSACACRDGWPGFWPASDQR